MSLLFASKIVLSLNLRNRKDILIFSMRVFERVGC